MNPPITETEFQSQVVELAHLFRWRHLHIRRSIGKGRAWTTTTNLVGWPDLVLMRPDVGTVAAELKVGRNRPTPEQAELIAFLGSLPGWRAYVWTPGDWDEITATLAVPRRHDVTT